MSPPGGPCHAGGRASAPGRRIGTARSRLGVDDHVRDVGARAADRLLDLAPPCVRVLQAARPAETAREEGDEPLVVRAQEAELARRAARRLEDDPADDGL